MNFLYIFALTLANVFAFDLRGFEPKQGNISLPFVDDSRITNGQSATLGQFPYQAFLAMSPYYCGGTLIGQNWVLTAGHCIVKANSVTVYLGSIRSNQGEVVRRAYKKDMIVHEKYYDINNFIQYDIALIRIATVTYSANIQPIKLPALSSSNDSYAGYKAFAVGWGKTSDSSGSSKYLRWGRMAVITNEVCYRSFGNRINSRHICTSTYGAISPCYGDSGGPLILENGNIQIGLTALLVTSSCVQSNPAGFTRLTSYLDWIKYHTGIYY